MITTHKSAVTFARNCILGPVYMEGREGAPAKQGNIPVKSKLQHPPQATPGHLNFWEIFFQIPPSPGQKGDQMPPPPGKLLNDSAQRISSFTGTWMKESRLRRLQLLNKI